MYGLKMKFYIIGKIWDKIEHLKYIYKDHLKSKLNILPLQSITARSITFKKKQSKQ